ncbi:MAG: hypothetical protein PUD09_07095 [Coriobacteriales bacterium]|nr:hypothetical protein [Coriobacteriales bacterium]
MKVTLVYNDGNIDSYETAQDSFHSTSHSKLSTFVEESSADADEDDEKRTVTMTMGIELTPVAGIEEGLPIRARRIVELNFESDHLRHAAPSIAKVCEFTEGLQMLIVDGVVVWKGDPGVYLPDDGYDNISLD